MPSLIDEKRALLCQDVNAARLFAIAPTSRVYFGYAYKPKQDDNRSKIQGVQVIDILASFIQYAHLSKDTQIKIVLPIDVLNIEKARQRYASVFSDCTIQYTDLTTTNLICQGTGLLIEVFNLFPFSNDVFRQLMDYATACKTPIAVTGDQSFMETFFTMQEGFVFIYQLLEHKVDLFNAVKSIAEGRELRLHLQLFQMIEKNIKSEATLIELTRFLFENHDVLKQESRLLTEEIQAQPDFVSGLSRAFREYAIIPRRSTRKAHQAFADDDVPSASLN